MSMHAMVLPQLGTMGPDDSPLRWMELPIPEPGEGEILVKVTACGVCHTELDEIEGRTPPPTLPMVLGHQVVGRVVAQGPRTHTWDMGARVGIAWIYRACGECNFCQRGLENLCPKFQATGRDAYGGYAQYLKVPAAFAYALPENFSDVQAAPLLCAGAIGYRSLRLTGLQDGQHLGLTGFGASGHLVLKMVRHRYPHTQVYVFARSEQERNFARELGAVWSGATEACAPCRLDAIIDTTPAWKPVVQALQNLAPGGRLVINAIRKEVGDQEQLLQLDYPAHLWLEKEIKSVANVTRQDVSEFLQLAAEIPLQPETQQFSLADANRALQELKQRKIRGAKVLCVE